MAKNDNVITQTNAVKGADAKDIESALTAWHAAVANERSICAKRQTASADAERFSREAVLAEKETHERHDAYLDALESAGKLPPRK